jgi:ankyrin repeat protein
MASRSEDLFVFTKQGNLESLEANELSFKDLYNEDLTRRTLFSYARRKQAILNFFYQKACVFFQKDNVMALDKSDRKGRGLLHWAIMCFQDQAVLSNLIDNGADINFSKPPFYITPCYQAVQDENKQALAVLLSASVDIHKLTENLATPLHTAAENGNPIIIKQLLDAGAKVNEPCDKGGTPIFIAAQKGHHDALQLLIDAGSNVNKHCISNATPLFAAIQNGHTESVKRLINADANVNDAFQENIKMIDVAKHFNHTDIIRLLKEAGAAS